jgi:hypothetical protein
MGRNGERERSLYNFLSELSEELNEATDDMGAHSTYSREMLAELCSKLQKSLNFLISTRDAKIQVGNFEMEALKALAYRDIDQQVTLRYCMLELDKFLAEFFDLDIDLVDRIKNKLNEIKSPAPFDAGQSPVPDGTGQGPEAI